MGTIGNAVRLCWFALAAMVAGCATAVPRPAQVVSMGAHAPAPDSAFPAEGGIWRLDDSEFKALGPIPAEPAPDEPGATPGGLYRPPVEARDYRSYSYIAPFPAIIYSGPWFGFAYRHPAYPPHHSRSWRARRR